MTNQNIQTALKNGKMPFKVSNSTHVHYTLASSFEQCKAKFEGDIETTSGDVTVKGTHKGKIETLSGKISISKHEGDIKM